VQRYCGSGRVIKECTPKSVAWPGLKPPPPPPPPFESHSHHPSDVPLPFPTSHLSVTLTFFNANMRIPSNHWIGISVTTPNFININIINSATELSFSTSPVEWPSNRYDRPSILAEWLFEDFMTYKG